jgi:diphthamide biosynthesis protein 3
VFQRDKRDKKQTESKLSYDDVEIEDTEWNEEMQAFTYPCPCGDLFQITKEDLKMGEEIARCPSCSLYITVIYNLEDFQGRPPPPPQKKTGPPKGTTTLITVA